MTNRSLGLLLLAAACAHTSARPKSATLGVCTATDDSCRAFLEVGGGRVAYWRSHGLDQPNPQITRAIVVIHGVAFNANEYFGHVVGAVAQAQAGATTLVLAPLLRQQPAGPRDLYWPEIEYQGGGGGARTGRRPRELVCCDRRVARAAGGSRAIP
jgi:hypothetical protein